MVPSNDTFRQTLWYPFGTISKYMGTRATRAKPYLCLRCHAPPNDTLREQHGNGTLLAPQANIWVREQRERSHIFA